MDGKTRTGWDGGAGLRRGTDLQDCYVGTDPDVVADGDWLADALPLEALVEPHGICGGGWFSRLAACPFRPGVLVCWWSDPLAGRERHPEAKERCCWEKKTHE